METSFNNTKIKTEALLLMEVASLFTRANLTGEHGCQVLDSAAALMRDSKKTRSRGGLLAALADLYANKELPVTMVERIVLVLAPGHAYRENMGGSCERAVQLFLTYRVDVSKPWRECLAQLFTAMAEEKESGYKALRDIATVSQEQDTDSEEEAL